MKRVAATAGAGLMAMTLITPAAAEVQTGPGGWRLSHFPTLEDGNVCTVTRRYEDGRAMELSAAPRAFSALIVRVAVPDLGVPDRWTSGEGAAVSLSVDGASIGAENDASVSLGRDGRPILQIQIGGGDGDLPTEAGRFAAARQLTVVIQQRGRPPRLTGTFDLAGSAGAIADLRRCTRGPGTPAEEVSSSLLP
jgi:hypothetical protein